VKKKKMKTERIFLAILAVTLTLSMSIAMTAASDTGNSYISQSIAQDTASTLINEVYNQAQINGKEFSASWKQIQAGIPVLVHNVDYVPKYYIVPGVDPNTNDVITRIGVDANTGEWQWYVEECVDKTFPRVSQQEAKEVALKFMQEQKISGQISDPLCVDMPNSRLYWGFQVSNGNQVTSIYVNVDDISEIYTNLDKEELRLDMPPLNPVDFSGGSQSLLSKKGKSGVLTSNFVGITSYDQPLTCSRDAPPSHDIDITHYYQETAWYCGEASLEMVFDYYGPRISQDDIGDVANEDPSYGTYASDLRRAAHFSDRSTAIQNPALQGYTERPIGYGTHERWSSTSWLDDLKEVIALDHPIIILGWYSAAHSSGHFRVVKGYDDNLGEIITHDPWYTAPFQGPNQHFSYAYFNDLWSYSNYWGMMTSPWAVSVACPSTIPPGTTFTVTATVEYVYTSYLTSQYTASNSQAQINLPSGYSLAPGETQTKTISITAPGSWDTVSWDVVAPATPVSGDTITVDAFGDITGSSYSYSSYTDRIGGTGSAVIGICPTPPSELADAIVASSSKPALIGVSFTGNCEAAHVFTSPVGFLSATDGDTFLILSTGVAANIPGNPEDFESTDFPPWGPGGDTASLTLDFVVPDDATTLGFDFRFMSEEFPEWVGSAFNDFFYAYLTDSTGTHQIAYDTNGNIINVNNNFFNPAIYPAGTVFDGTTPRLTTVVDVTPGETISLRFEVGDVGDGIYDTAVWIDNVRFNVEGEDTTPPADVLVVKHGPTTVEQGKQMTYTISYFNDAEVSAENVVITDNLPSQAEFVSASDGGLYDPTTHSVSWDLNTLPAFSGGSCSLAVSVHGSVSIGTNLHNIVSISTTSVEITDENNEWELTTTVTGSASLPPNVDVEPTISNYNGVPIIWWTDPITFTYHGNPAICGVDINIHLDDGGPDIGGPMTQITGTYDWIFTATFYPRYGYATVTYTVHYCDGTEETVSHDLLVDPSGYVYDKITGERISGASVTLKRFDSVLQQFVFVSPSDPGMDPAVNPQTTDEYGGYGWMVSPGTYKVEAEKDGYYSNYAIVTVPPPAMNVNIPLEPIAIEDTIPPTIESVTLDAYTTIPDATIHVTVEATDNVGITTVTADGVDLEETGSIWEGDITAPSTTGDYTLTITAEDAAGNFAETTVDYSVVNAVGGLGVAIMPKISSAMAGSTLPLEIKIVSTENFDDVLHVYLTLDGIPPDYQADLSWFNWTDTTVHIPIGQEIVLPIAVDIPSGTSVGYKSFGVKVESTKWGSKAQDYGAIMVS